MDLFLLSLFCSFDVFGCFYASATCLNYHNFIYQFLIKYSRASSHQSCSFSRVTILDPWLFYINFRISLNFIFLSQDFDRNCIGYINQLVKSWHFYYNESFPPWDGHDMSSHLFIYLMKFYGFLDGDLTDPVRFVLECSLKSLLMVSRNIVDFCLLALFQ